MSIFKRGAASVIIRLKILDSASTTGEGKTGLAHDTADLIVSTIADNEATATAYTGANLETITTLGTYAAPTAGKARFKEVDATNHPGVYEIQLADARFAVASSRSLLISVLGASGAAQADLLIDLATIDPNAAAFPANLTQIDGLATSGNNATLNLKQLNIINNSGNALVSQSTGSNGHGHYSAGHGTGVGHYCSGGNAGIYAVGYHGIDAYSNTSGTGFGLYGHAVGTGAGIGAGNTLGSAISAISTGGNGHGALFAGHGTGNGSYHLSGASSGAVGLRAEGQVGNNHGFFGQSAGTGSGIMANSTGTGAAIRGLAASGDVLLLASSAGNGSAIKLTPHGTGVGISGTLSAVNTAIAELSAIPGATASLTEMVQFLYEYSRNKIETEASAQTLYKNDGTTALGAAVISKTGTKFTRNRME